MVAQAVGGAERFTVPPGPSSGGMDDRGVLATAQAFLASEDDREQQPRTRDEYHRTAPVFFTADGRIVINRMVSHVSDKAANYLASAIARIDTRDRDYIVEGLQFSSIIGYSMVVETKPDDDIWYGIRPRRRTAWSRLVMGRAAELTDTLTVVMCRREEDVRRRVFEPNYPVGYILITAYFGRPAEQEPEDTIRLPGTRFNTPAQAIETKIRAERTGRARFWENHAFVLSRDYRKSTLVYPTTLTKKYPWTTELSFAGWDEMPTTLKRKLHHSGRYYRISETAEIRLVGDCVFVVPVAPSEATD